ncbi:MAG: sigma-70 family RNA polymerase sigma factor [Thermoguttaceae bacterium]
MEDLSSPLKTAIKPEEWLRAYGDYLFRYALSRLRDANAAEEVVQETFVAGLRAADQYAGKGAERAWLLGILKRKIIDHIRRRNRTSGLPLSESEEGWGDSFFDASGHWKADPRFLSAQPSDALEREEFWAAFRDCLAKLPQRQADAFVLRELDDAESDAICKELEISTSNLWVLLHRARLQLAKCLQARWKGEPTS